jgi:hypothetical protein
MDVAKNNVARVEKNYLNDNQFMCKMSPDELELVHIWLKTSAHPT